MEKKLRNKGFRNSERNLKNKNRLNSILLVYFVLEDQTSPAVVPYLETESKESW